MKNKSAADRKTLLLFGASLLTMVTLILAVYLTGGTFKRSNHNEIESDRHCSRVLNQEAGRVSREKLAWLAKEAKIGTARSELSAKIGEPYCLLPSLQAQGKVIERVVYILEFQPDTSIVVGFADDRFAGLDLILPR
ncbi:hypothetical protein GC174_08740 [bacterium]|nr:hypothetical protein [bacterium]